VSVCVCVVCVCVCVFVCVCVSVCVCVVLVRLGDECLLCSCMKALPMESGCYACQRKGNTKKKVWSGRLFLLTVAHYLNSGCFHLRARSNEAGPGPLTAEKSTENL